MLLVWFTLLRTMSIFTMTSNFCNTSYCEAQFNSVRLFLLCSSRKYPHPTPPPPPPRRDWNFLGGGGIFIEISRGVGVLEKKHSVGEVWILSGIKHCTFGSLRWNIRNTVNSSQTDTGKQLYLQTLFSISLFTSQSNSVFTHSHQWTLL